MAAKKKIVAKTASKPSASTSKPAAAKAKGKK